MIHYLLVNFICKIIKPIQIFLKWAPELHIGIKQSGTGDTQSLAKKGIRVKFLDLIAPKTKSHKTIFPLFSPWKYFLPMFSLIFEQMEIFLPVLALETTVSYKKKKNQPIHVSCCLGREHFHSKSKCGYRRQTVTPTSSN